MAGFLVDKGIVHKKDGTVVGRIERGDICDELGEAFLHIKGNAIVNNYGTLIAKVEGNSILSASGGPFGKISDARLCFDNSNNMPDIEVAAIWLPFAKGIK